MLASNSIPATDDWLGPVLSALGTLTQQIQGIDPTTVFTELPELPQAGVIFPIKNWEVLDDTNAKLKVRWTIDIQHLFTFSRLQDTMQQAQAYIPAWLKALSAWPNQDLGGIAITTTPKSGKLAEAVYGGNRFLALINTVQVTTEYNILLS
jgi:hypothetical protein